MFESLIPRGKMGRPEEIPAVALVSGVRQFELREWGGVVCRRRLFGHLNSRAVVDGGHRHPAYGKTGEIPVDMGRMFRL